MTASSRAVRGFRSGAALAFGLLLFGCSDDGDDQAPSGVSAVLADNIATVVQVSWTTKEASTGYVEYGPTEEMEFNTPIEDDATREHARSLLGLKADTVYYYRVVTWDGDDAGASGVKTIRTGDLPVGMPPLTKTGEGHDEFIVAPVLGVNTAVLILDRDGDIVWAWKDDRDLDFYRARLSVDGRSLLYNAANVQGEPAADSEIVRVALDGSESSSVEIPFLAHDFVEHPDGTLGAMVVEFRDFEGTELRGDKIVEIAPDGTETAIWSAWDCFDPAEVTGDEIELGWTFGNALDYDPNEEKYYLGMRNFSSIAKIDRATGACEWVIGLSAPTFTFAEGSETFLHQHQFHLRGNRLLVMDNDGALGRQSRVLEYELDFDAMVATQVWSYTSTPVVYTFVLGEPIRFDNGDTFINWSAAGQLERVNAASESIWKVNTGAGFVFGFNTLAESLYPPAARRP